MEITFSVALTILVGFLLLLLGRRLFWLFVGAVGFVIGMNLATQYLAGQPDWIIMVVALVVGLVGAVLAVVFQRVAVAIAGFLAGSYLAVYILTILGVDMAQFTWIIQLVGGIIGGLLVFILFDWALILLSSLVGASMVAGALVAEATEQTLLFLLLLVIGLIVQAGLFYRSTPREPRRRRTRRG